MVGLSLIEGSLRSVIFTHTHTITHVSTGMGNNYIPVLAEFLTYLFRFLHVRLFFIKIIIKQTLNTVFPVFKLSFVVHSFH